MRRALAVVVVAVAGLLAACGVSVPDDVAAALRGPETTAAEATTTTETPESDDELAQALIDNGYSDTEAECGAERLRAALDEREVASIVEADSIEDISASTGRAFAAAMRPCLEGGPNGSRPEPPDEDEDDDDAPTPGDGRPVSRAEFLSGLISGGIPEDQARCIVAGVYRQLGPEEIAVLFRAESQDDIPDDVLDTFETISDGCER